MNEAHGGALAVVFHHEVGGDVAFSGAVTGEGGHHDAVRQGETGSEFKRFEKFHFWPNGALSWVGKKERISPQLLFRGFRGSGGGDDEGGSAGDLVGDGVAVFHDEDLRENVLTFAGFDIGGDF